MALVKLEQSYSDYRNDSSAIDELNINNTVQAQESVRREELDIDTQGRPIGEK
jgi:stress response protein YsnF